MLYHLHCKDVTLYLDSWLAPMLHIKCIEKKIWILKIHIFLNLPTHKREASSLSPKSQLSYKNNKELSTYWHKNPWI